MVSDLGPPAIRAGGDQSCALRLVSCATTGWVLTGYYVPQIEDWPTSPSCTVNIAAGDASFSGVVQMGSGFISSCYTEGTGVVSGLGPSGFLINSLSRNVDGTIYSGAAVLLPNLKAVLGIASAVSNDAGSDPFNPRATALQSGTNWRCPGLPPTSGIAWGNFRFTVNDTGGFTDTQHIDVFCGIGSGANFLTVTEFVSHVVCVYPVPSR